MARKKSNNPKPTVLHVRRVLWAVLTLAVAGVAVRAIQHKEQSIVSGIGVEVAALPGNHFLIQEEDIREILNRSFVRPLDKGPVGGVDVGRVESVLERDPFIAGAEVYFDALDSLQVLVDQRNPLLRIKDNNGLDYYLDPSGEHMPLSRHYTARVLVFTGNIAPYSDNYREQEDHPLIDLLEFARMVRADPFLDALVEQVYINNRTELVLAPKVGDQTILLGRFDERTPERLERLKTFYREGLPYEGWQKYSQFDLRYEDQVVCKKRE